MHLSDTRLHLSLLSKLVLGFCVLFIFAVEPVVAQDICANCESTYQSPVASPGGPYIGMTGQSIQMNGLNSWSDYGWITGYYWDFGDGTSGSGPSPTHQYSADGVYTVSLWVSDSEGNWASSEIFVTVDSASLPVRLTFDELPNNTVVADQYYNQYGVRFYSNNFFYPVHTYQTCGFCSTTSLLIAEFH